LNILFDMTTAARLLVLWGLLLLPAWFAFATEPAPYRLDVGDRVRITVFEQPSLSGEFTVSPTATLSLPLVGRILARGLSPDALEALLADRFAKSAGIKEPKVNVEITAFRPFYILGAVEAPGQYPYVVEMTVLHAISLAGGFRRPALSEAGSELDIARLHERYQTVGDSLSAALARRARLIAERDERSEIEFPDSLRATTTAARANGIMINERRIRQLRDEALQNESAMLMTQKSIISDEISALEKQLAAKGRLAEINQQEMSEIDKLRQRDLVPITRVLALRRSATEIESDRIQLIAAIARARQEMTKVDITLVTLKRNRSIQVAESLRQADDDVAQLTISRGATTEQIRQAELVHGRASLFSNADQIGGDLVIVRRTADGTVEIKADDFTPVLPGDLVKVPLRMAPIDTNGGPAPRPR